MHGRFTGFDSKRTGRVRAGTETRTKGEVRTCAVIASLPESCSLNRTALPVASVETDTIPDPVACRRARAEKDADDGLVREVDSRLWTR